MKDSFSGYLNKLSGKIYGLLCEKEKSGSEWEKFLEGILIEVMGFPENKRTINYWTLLCKLSALNQRFMNFTYFRKTIFECINIVQEMAGDNECQD